MFIKQTIKILVVCTIVTTSFAQPIASWDKTQKIDVFSTTAYAAEIGTGVVNIEVDGVLMTGFDDNIGKPVIVSEDGVSRTLVPARKVLRNWLQSNLETRYRHSSFTER